MENFFLELWFSTSIIIPSLLHIHWSIIGRTDSHPIRGHNSTKRQTNLNSRKNYVISYV